MIGVANPTSSLEPGGRRPGHPRHRTVRHHRRPATASTPPGAMAATVGIAPAQRRRAATLAVMQGLLGFTSEARWLRYAGRHLRHLFPYLPGQSGYNKRLRRTTFRAAGPPHPGRGPRHQPVERRRLGGGLHPAECGRSRETAKRSALAGWAQYGYCASHSALLLGPAVVPRGRPRPGPARGGRPDRPQGRRARGPGGPVGRRPPAGVAARRGAGPRRRQGLHVRRNSRELGTSRAVN